MATSGRQDFSIPLQAGPARAQSFILYIFFFFFVLGRRTCSAYIISIKIIINSEVKFFAAKIVIYFNEEFVR